MAGPTAGTSNNWAINAGGGINISATGTGARYRATGVSSAGSESPGFVTYLDTTFKGGVIWNEATALFQVYGASGTGAIGVDGSDNVGVKTRLGVGALAAPTSGAALQVTGDTTTSGYFQPTTGYKSAAGVAGISDTFVNTVDGWTLTCANGIVTLKS